MIHQNPELNAAEAISDWRDAVAIGDIVRWPLGGNAEEGDSLALVIDIETIGNWKVLTIAPGIDDVAQPVRPGTLRLTRLDEVRNAGLMRSVRFELGRRISVAPQHPSLAADVASPALTDDRHHGRSTRSRHGRAPDRRRSVITERREIEAPAPRSRCNRGSSGRTVIVEHRGRRMLRPTPSAA